MEPIQTIIKEKNCRVNVLFLLVNYYYRLGYQFHFDILEIDFFFLTYDYFSEITNK